MTTVAVLRTILGIKDEQMAELLGCSRHAIHSLESGRLKLSDELATKMFHETGISLDWLLEGDPSAPAISARGEPYTRAKFDEAQAKKIYYDRPTPKYRNLDAFSFCTRIIAILKSAATRKNYHMASYKAHVALGSLEREFGTDEELYRYSGPSSLIGANFSRGLPPLKEVVATVEQVQDMLEAPSRRKKRSSPARRAPRA
jgi:transcriptional regulator with XRE-family HTH domain